MTLADGGFTSLIPINEVNPSVLHRVAEFCCGTPSLDTFLHTQAKDLHIDHLNHTSLLFHNDFGGLAGYIAMGNDSIPLNISEVGELGLSYNIELTSYPAVKIGRLAVHQDLQGQKIGRKILDLAIGQLIGVQTVTAARLMITDAINDSKVVAFYLQCGFEKSLWADNQAKHHTRGKQRTTIKMIRDIYAA